MTLQILTQIQEIDEASWQAIVADAHPFYSYPFLSALEKHHCVGPELGWLPRHLVWRNPNNEIIGILPQYLKLNSYGEFVFDWAWADALQRTGRAYYPKLVSCIPYTPVTGKRLFINNDSMVLKKQFIQKIIQYAAEQNISSWHCLFPSLEDKQLMINEGLLHRVDCQFHWTNNNYTNFDDFLTHFSSRKRKNVRKERQKVAATGIQIEVLHGADMDRRTWALIYPFYAETFFKKGGVPTLSLEFFIELSEKMGENIVVITALYQQEYVAAAICFRNQDTLFGRHWGCKQAFDSLHFELCYYQGIEYAIKEKLYKFEPGAQGLHKISRGFLPTATWSTHWIRDADFKHAIKRHLALEQKAVLEHIETLKQHSPFRKNGPK